MQCVNCLGETRAEVRLSTLANSGYAGNASARPSVAKFQFVLLIHAHQPVGNFDHVIESAYAQSYLPFVQVLARHPSIHMGLHYTGSLLEWIERAHPEYFDLLRTLMHRGQGGKTRRGGGDETHSL